MGFRNVAELTRGELKALVGRDVTIGQPNGAHIEIPKVVRVVIPRNPTQEILARIYTGSGPNDDIWAGIHANIESSIFG